MSHTLLPRHEHSILWPISAFPASLEIIAATRSRPEDNGAVLGYVITETDFKIGPLHSRIQILRWLRIAFPGCLP